MGLPVSLRAFAAHASLLMPNVFHACSLAGAAKMFVEFETKEGAAAAMKKQYTHDGATISVRGSEATLILV